MLFNVMIRRTFKSPMIMVDRMCHLTDSGLKTGNLVLTRDYQFLKQYKLLRDDNWCTSNKHQPTTKHKT